MAHGRFLTTHVGSLPRPQDLMQMMWTREDGDPYDAAALQARIASNTASPGTEAELRHMIESTATGKIDYSRMEPLYAEALRTQEAQAIQTMQNMGPIKSIEFKGVGQMGWDGYDVHFANGTLNARIVLGSSGKIAGLMIMAAP